MRKIENRKLKIIAGCTRLKRIHTTERILTALITGSQRNWTSNFGGFKFYQFDDFDQGRNVDTSMEKGIQINICHSSPPITGQSV